MNSNELILHLSNKDEKISKGFIKRIDNKEDKRSKLIQLTKSAKEIVKKSLSDVQSCRCKRQKVIICTTFKNSSWH